MAKARLATTIEVKDTLQHERIKHPTADIDALHQKAIEEGYKDEVCPKCKAIFLAHHHMLDCTRAECPMRGKSVLDILLEETDKEVSSG